MRYFSEMATPIGPVTIVTDGESITGVTMRPAADVIGRAGVWIEDDAPAGEAREQLTAYFAGDLRQFSLSLAPSGTPFQKRVWAALQQIPYGETTSYGALAAALGHPGSARAVGTANRTNPIGIIVPCHRVIGADGTLTGYAAGIERKKFLLEHEGALAGSIRQTELEILE